MKTIALFGSTGRTGQKFLDKALSKGYNVKALVRDQNKLKQKHELLRMLEGDVLNPKDVDSAIKGTDIVVSLFGHVKGSPKGLQTNGTKNIIKAMQRHQVKRIISLSGGGLPFPEKDQPKFIDKLIRTIMKIAVPKILNDAIAHAEVLRQSDRNWMIVRAPRLTNDNEKGNYKVGWVGVDASTKISRSDLADFILTQVEDTTFNKQMPFVSE
jgi:putative NADH-flavin reductase